jgi:hypothetical protein
MKNIFIYILVSACSLTYNFCLGQSQKKIRLIYKSIDINKSSNDTLQIKRVRSATFSDSVIVRLKNKTKIVLPPDKIWGYQDDDSIIHRYYEGEFFELRQQDILFIYSKKSGKYSTDSYYFSKGADGKLLSMKWKNIKKEFAENTCFLNKMDKELKWYQDYSSYNSKTKTYRIIEFFKSCIDNPKN